MRFAKDVYESTGVPIGILQFAVGGTGLNHWARPVAPDASGRLHLYERALKGVRLSGGRIAGILWWQGEGFFGGTPSQYLVPFKKLIGEFRSDLKDPDLPWIFAQLERMDAPPVYNERTAERYSNLRESFRLAELEIPNTAMIVTIDQPRMDVVHITTPGLKVIGSRFALAARALVYGQDIYWSGPRFTEAVFADSQRTEVLVKFDDVDRQLLPAKDIEGFDVVDGYKVLPAKSVERDSEEHSAVRIILTAPAPNGSRVRYGFGRDPDVNLSDASMLPAALFAPQPIK